MSCECVFFHSPLVGAEWWIQHISADKPLSFHVDKDESIATFQQYLGNNQISTTQYIHKQTTNKHHHTITIDTTFILVESRSRCTNTCKFVLFHIWLAHCHMHLHLHLHLCLHLSSRVSTVPSSSSRLVISFLLFWNWRWYTYYKSIFTWWKWVWSCNTCWRYISKHICDMHAFWKTI